MLKAIRDPDELASAASGTSLDIRRLSASRGPSRLAQWRGEWWSLDIAELQARIEAQGPLAEADAILVVQQGNESTICGRRLESRTILIIPAGSSIHANIHPGLKYMGLVLPPSIWADVQLAASGSCLQNVPDQVRAVRGAAPDVAQAQIARLLAEIDVRQSSGIDVTPEVQRLVSDAACLIAAALDATQSFEDLSAAHMRHVRRARDCIHANTHRRIAISELCQAAGVSRRQLEYSFRASLGVSPRDYIAVVRLNEIRRALKQGRGTGASVTAIALDHGVTHLSRFAQDYRRLFDELPSETIGKRAELSRQDTGPIEIS